MKDLSAATTIDEVEEWLEEVTPVGYPMNWTQVGQALQRVAEITAPRWLPIETAPRDGTEILICASDRPLGKHATVAWWEKEKWYFCKYGPISLYSGDKITHWMPVAQAPAE